MAEPSSEQLPAADGQEKEPLADPVTRWPGAMGRYRREIVLAAIGLLFALLLSLDPPEALTLAGWRAFCLFVLIVLLWITNLIPLAITSLLAIAMIPILGIMPMKVAYGYFGSEVVFFIMGAFIMGAALVGSGLSSRVAMVTINRYGSNPKSLITSIFLIGAIGSCIMSEHAVAAMLFPIAMSITRTLDLKRESRVFGRSLFQALAFGCIAGGTLTILGGGRGPLGIGILREFTDNAMTIGFVEYIAFDLPLVITMLVAGWFILTRQSSLGDVDTSEAQKRLRTHLRHQGRITRREMGVGLIMLGTILLWITRGETIGLANIAICAVAVLFVFKLMTWQDVEEGVNWGILLMYGGAICLGASLHESGTTAWLISGIRGADTWSPQMILLLLAFIAMVLTELMSNSAVIAVLLPAALEIGAMRGIDLRIVTMGIILPSNFAFSFPMATPANALAYSSGFLDMRTMVSRGIVMDLIGFAAFAFLVFVYWPMLGYSMGA
jgi:sodium-dependent dicarboxylate transporter 2/3/5